MRKGELLIVLEYNLVYLNDKQYHLYLWGGEIFWGMDRVILKPVQYVTNVWFY
ncbi:hypothetical protein GCM10007922_17140 [Shewanella decolorationis]|nr:hypothetical protein GCM10007922_17140 [Shewanella decolorationis]